MMNTKNNWQTQAAQLKWVVWFTKENTSALNPRHMNIRAEVFFFCEPSTKNLVIFLHGALLVCFSSKKGFHHCKSLTDSISSHTLALALGTKCWTVIRKSWTVIRNCSTPLGRRFLGLINAVVKKSNTQFLVYKLFFSSNFFENIK